MRQPLLAIIAAGIAACGSSGSGGPAAGPESVVQSPGGQWLAVTGQALPISLTISEQGEVLGLIPAGGQDQPPFFVAGSVSVSGNNTVTGALQGQLFGLFPPLTSPPDFMPVPLPAPPPVDPDAVVVVTPAMIDCGIVGTVIQYASLTVTITCSTETELLYDERGCGRSQLGKEFPRCV